LADIGGIEFLAVRSIIAWFATIAVDALSVVSAVLTHTTAIVIAVNIQGLTIVVYFFVILALVRVAETVAS
jgi:Na+-transporting NADH:ubiquinone oxidoreductase subunit NqrE